MQEGADVRSVVPGQRTLRPQRFSLWRAIAANPKECAAAARSKTSAAVDKRTQADERALTSMMVLRDEEAPCISE